MQGPHCRAPQKEGERASGADLLRLTSGRKVYWSLTYSTSAKDRIEEHSMQISICWYVAVDILFRLTSISWYLQDKEAEATKAKM